MGGDFVSGFLGHPLFGGCFFVWYEGFVWCEGPFGSLMGGEDFDKTDGHQKRTLSAQGTGHGAQGTGHRAQGTGHGAPKMSIHVTERTDGHQKRTFSVTCMDILG